MNAFAAALAALSARTADPSRPHGHPLAYERAGSRFRRMELHEMVLADAEIVVEALKAMGCAAAAAARAACTSMHDMHTVRVGCGAHCGSLATLRRVSYRAAPCHGDLDA
jgi:hypothetical protein